MIIPHVPASIHQTGIYARIEADDARNGLLSLMNVFISSANPIVDSIIAGPFETYTLHNRDHVKKVVHLAEYIMGPDTLANLTTAECVIFVYAAYMHDMGMAVTAGESERIFADPEFQRSMEKWPELNEALEKSRGKLKTVTGADRPALESEISDLLQAGLANYLRPLHATGSRYRDLIALLKRASNRADLFSINGQSFEPILIEICESHNLSATVLGEMKSAYNDRFARKHPIGGFVVNTQFLAAVLRLADVLDFDYERTPRSLFESLGIRHSRLPGSEVTLHEWQKHLAVHTIEITDTEIIVSGTCRHPIIEAGIREFADVIQKEVQETLAVLRRNPSDIQTRYALGLPNTVRANIHSDGYVFMDLALKLDETAVMSLLMGTQLYDSSYAAARELVQNAVDAALVRGTLNPDPDYMPTVTVESSVVDGDRWLICRDNGVGMDEYVLRDHFFRVGSSYYRSHDFKQLLRNVGDKRIPIGSRFGIGFLSTFMLGDELEIETRKLYPGGGTSMGYRIRIERMGALAFVQEDDAVPFGTTVKLKLKDDDPSRTLKLVEKYLSVNVIRPGCTVEVNLAGATRRFSPGQFYQLQIQDSSEVHKLPIEVISLDMKEDIDGLSGRIFLLFGREANGKLSAFVGTSLIEITQSYPTPGRVKVDPRRLISGFEGNRISLAGFKMSLDGLGRLFRSVRSSVSAIYDVDIKPSDDVHFNVPRTKLLDAEMRVRLRLRKAVLRALSENGTLKRLTPETRVLIELPAGRDDFDASPDELRKRVEKIRKANRFEPDADLLSAVQAALPKNHWPVRVHRAIAEQLQIRPVEAYAAISTLIATGAVSNPNRNKASNIVSPD